MYFVTFCTLGRKRIGSLTTAQATFEIYAGKAFADFNVAVGRYVVMPDHLHLFVRGGQGFRLSPWVGGLKRALSVALHSRGSLWQPGFFDHILRSDESYSEKWQYVRDNPVRARLVTNGDYWPYQGEIVLIDRA